MTSPDGMDGAARSGGARPVRMDDLTIERVLRTVEAIPPGRVAAYGQVGAIAGVGPRLVGRIVRDWGGGVPWWRVTGHDGEVAPPLRARAFAHWDEEGIVRAPSGRGCRMSEHGADLGVLRTAARAAWSDLPDPGPDGRGEADAYSTGMSSRKK